MTNSAGLGALFIHPHGDYSGNLLWPGELPPSLMSTLSSALEEVRARGYFASAFLKGDGVTFNGLAGHPYDPDRALADFTACFGFLDLEVATDDESTQSVLARLSGDRVVTLRYLAPADGLQLEAPLTLGKTKIHPPVDGEDYRLSDHPWRALCDVPGADVDPNWTPSANARGSTALLAYPLIERSIQAPLRLVYEAKRSQDAQSPLLRLIMEDADRALDPVRFNLCSFRRLAYLPARPGWRGDVASIHVIPETRAFEEWLLQGKPYVLRVANTWLGLEVDASVESSALALVDLVDSADQDEMTLALKAALRAFNQALYIVELEAAFLHLVYALDALCEPGKLTGDRHRLWISAFASHGDAARFAQVLADFDRLYSVRNRIVHQGQTFASLGLVGEVECQAIHNLFGAVLNVFLRRRLATHRQAMIFAFGLLTSPAFQPALSALGPKQFNLPLAADKPFTKHMQP
ncbi:HEPN domain-containing protein [Caulobacter sp. SL161]|uniref:HEPN domain-containing protein n=1 Tax=Caulobacter sp. SL161 TaxID=2995156 RepID=UPI00227418B7|nr:HEPN domain-containing protein [Caulobacter sp. SL161]MCY1646651.1 HEPN domain-containing protein [Caulobacter sp. SL161]